MSVVVNPSYASLIDEVGDKIPTNIEITPEQRKEASNDFFSSKPCSPLRYFNFFVINEKENDFKYQLDRLKLDKKLISKWSTQPLLGLSDAKTILIVNGLLYVLSSSLFQRPDIRKAMASFNIVLALIFSLVVVSRWEDRKMAKRYSNMVPWMDEKIKVLKYLCYMRSVQKCILSHDYPETIQKDFIDRLQGFTCITLNKIAILKP